MLGRSAAHWGDRWFWSITCVLTEDTPMTGHAPTREEAKA